MERVKKRAYGKILANDYFWRTWDQHEIDLIEEREGSLFAYDFKWQSSKLKSAKLWKETYPGSRLQVVTKENYIPFIT